MSEENNQEQPLTRRDFFTSLVAASMPLGIPLYLSTKNSKEDLFFASVHEAAHAFTAHYYGLLESASLHVHRSPLIHAWFAVSGGAVTSKLEKETPLDIQTAKQFLNVSLSGVIGVDILGIDKPGRGGKNDLTKAKRLANIIAWNKITPITRSFTFGDILSNRFFSSIPNEIKQDVEKLSKQEIENSRQITRKLLEPSTHMIAEIAAQLRIYEELSEQEIGDIIRATQSAQYQPSYSDYQIS